MDAKRRGTGAKRSGEQQGIELNEGGLRIMIDLMFPLIPMSFHPQVHQRTEGLTYVVHQSEGVAPVTMMDADGRMMPCGNDSSRGSGAYDGITVVERGIGTGVWFDPQTTRMCYAPQA